MNSSQACLVCLYCDVGFKSSSDLARHLFEKHPSDDVNPSTKAPVNQLPARAYLFNQEQPLRQEEDPVCATEQALDGTGGAVCQCPECMAGWPAVALPSPQYPQPPPVPGFPGYPGGYWPFPQPTNQQQRRQWPQQPQQGLPPFPAVPGYPQARPTFAPLPYSLRPIVPVPVPGSRNRFVTPAPPAFTVMRPSDPIGPTNSDTSNLERAEGTWQALADPAPINEDARGAQPLRAVFPTLPRPLPRSVPPAPAAPQLADSTAGLLSLLQKAPFRWGDFSDSDGAFPLVQQQPDADTISTLQRQMQRLQSWSGHRLCVFGSLVQNLGSRHSDLDLCVAPVPKQSHAATLRAIAMKLRKNGFTRFDEVLTARVPILRSVPSGSAPVQFDISVASEGLANSWLVRAYVLANPDLVYPLASTLVTALKRCELHGNRIGCLSSFAVVIMVLHFLLWRGRIAFIAPPTALRFHEYEAFPPHQPLSPPKDHEAVRALLVDCLHFYSGPEASEAEKTQTDDAAGEVLSAETRYFPAERVAVRLTPQPWADILVRPSVTGEPRPLVVLDPVRPELDAARSLSKGNWQQIRQVFRLVASQAETHAGHAEQ